MKTCSYEGCKYPVWSKGRCKYHQEPKVISEERKEKIDKMREVFLSIWAKRPHFSEVSGEYLGSEPLTVFFHHILPKENYEDYCFDEENIILLSLDEHTNVENNQYRYPEINNRRDYLIKKYNL